MMEEYCLQPVWRKGNRRGRKVLALKTAEVAVKPGDLVVAQWLVEIASKREVQRVSAELDAPADVCSGARCVVRAIR